MSIGSDAPVTLAKSLTVRWRYQLVLLAAVNVPATGTHLCAAGQLVSQARASSAAGVAMIALQEKARGRKMYPRDESSTDTAFSAFKQRVLEAAERGDLRTLREALAPTLSYNFDTGTPDQVVRDFGLGEGVPWRALRDALRLGAVRTRDEEFSAPYVSADDQSVEVNAIQDELVVTGLNVRVRRSPDTRAEVVDWLSYDVVSQVSNVVSNLSRPYLQANAFENDDTPSGPDAWAHIRTPSGETGYVYGRFIRSPLDWRFRFGKVAGAWKIVALAVGD